jgi:RNA polymerase sigma factor (sigma-70 family)
MPAQRDMIAECQPERPDNATTTRQSADWMQQVDLTLIQRIAMGDVSAFESLYERYATRLANYLRRHLSSPELVDEALNDVMLVVWQRATQFQTASRVSTWLFGIARNKAFHAWQKQLREPTLQDPPEQWLEPDDPATSLQRQERDQTVAQALSRLSPELREVVELTYYHALSSPEIADQLSVSVHTVRSRLKLARRRLATIFEDVSNLLIQHQSNRLNS